MTQDILAEVLLPTTELRNDLPFYTKTLGMRMDMIYPADNPQVAVVSAMNHGGPFPATGHPGFTAVGVPGSVTRFGMLQCYDAVRQYRLPAVLQDRNPGGVWRRINGQWTTADV